MCWCSATRRSARTWPADGIAVPENGILLEGATITGSRGTAALLGHGALAADTAHRVDGGQAGRTGGVCGRTEQVRDALVAKARARAPFVNDCSQVNGSRLAAMTGTLQLGNKEIAALKPGDFEGLGGVGRWWSCRATRWARCRSGCWSR